MKKLDYSKIADYYDMVESNDESMENAIDEILRHNGSKTVLDMSAGTGKQSIFLARRGYEVTANDLSAKMLGFAKKKAKLEHLKIRFRISDMRTVDLGLFDAVVSMYNSIGHLNTREFLKMLSNIHKSLNPNGIYIFDIMDKKFAETRLPKYEFIGTAKTVGKVKIVIFIKYSLNGGRLRVSQRLIAQKGLEAMEKTKQYWDMRVYYKGELERLIKKAGFEVMATESSKWKSSSSNFIVARTL
jgi:2-polyprenyl-3-methyl-5-hydroxy-6-metoxy-1,4-benzoquinol methylase